MAFITAWSPQVPWPTLRQVEQDMLLSRLIIELANHHQLGPELAFRGGTCLHKLHLPQPLRYSEDLDYCRTTTGGVGPSLKAIQDIAHGFGFQTKYEQKYRTATVFLFCEPTEGGPSTESVLVPDVPLLGFSHLSSSQCNIRCPGSPAVVERPFRTAARYYSARPSYSAELLRALSEHLGWDGSGRLLDVGSGPGVIALELAQSFAEVIALDPEPEMLSAGKEFSAASNVRWVEGRAEDIPQLKLGSFDAITMAQSLHRTDQERTLQIVHDSLRSGGALLLIHHAYRGFGMPERPGFTPPVPQGPPGIPTIPYEVIWDALEQHMGITASAPEPGEERYAALLRRVVFGNCEELALPGRTDIIRTPESVLEMFLSTSFAAPERFGDRLDVFRDELLQRLRRLTDSGTFWDWPGDTEVLIARKG